MKKDNTIKNKIEFENAIATYSTLSAKVERFKNEKDAIDEQKKATEAQMDKLKAAAEAYALSHEDEVLTPGKKSGETINATYGFKKVQPTLEPASGKWEDVVEIIRSKFKALAKRVLSVKYSADKTALKALPEKKLAELGLSFKQGSGFYISPKKP